VGMIRSKTFILIGTLFVFLFCVAAKKKFTQQQNHAPVVKILSPSNNSSYNAGSLVHYKISVSDKEDGESKYDEIDEKQVLLEVKYFSDTSKLTTVNAKNEIDEPGLAALKTSNCFNCHGFDTKITGPSFNEIIKRYKPTAANTALLQKRIKSGSTSVWGKTPMPTHPELSDIQIKNMVQWIMQNASAPNVHYYIGLEGNFNLKPPSTTNKNGVYVVTASYTDRGLSNKDALLEGRDAIAVKVK
jgi:cytochrome c